VEAERGLFRGKQQQWQGLGWLWFREASPPWDWEAEREAAAAETVEALSRCPQQRRRPERLWEWGAWHEDLRETAAWRPAPCLLEARPARRYRFNA
jgi:hypothetical protein